MIIYNIPDFSEFLVLVFNIAWLALDCSSLPAEGRWSTLLLQLP